MKEDQQPTLSDDSIERYNSDASAIALRSIDDITRVSKIFVYSGMFNKSNNGTTEQQVYQAVVKVMAGVEFGIQPFAAMRGINIINGNAEMSANLMAAKVKKHPQYDYRVDTLDNDGCVLSFYEIVEGSRDKLGESSFSKEDAKQAGLTTGNWVKFPRNMYFARAMSNGVRLHCPDVFYGAPVYVEGEISEQVEEPQPEQPKQLQEPVEAEIVQQDPDSVVHRDIAEEEAQIAAETEDKEEPAHDDGYDEEDPELMTKVAAALMDIDMPDRSKSRLIRETTKKMTLKNCRHGDLLRVMEEIEKIKSGERVLTEDWFDQKETK